MKIYLERKRKNIKAVADYDLTTHICTVLKGSIVSTSIAKNTKFRGARAVENRLLETVSDGKVIKDVVFKSASSAANYIVGNSTNGLTTWKDVNGITLKNLIIKENKDE